MRTTLTTLAIAGLLLQAPAQAAFVFTAELSGAQEVPPVVTSAFGSATLWLNDTMDRLEIQVSLAGLDLDGTQTPDTDDNVTGLHIHAAPAGINGGVVFGLISPFSDTNGDLVIDALAGTVISAWDLTEGNGTTLDAQLPALFSEGLYLNVHTVAFPGGEIRGQIAAVPLPATSLLFAGGVAGLWRSRRRHNRPTAGGPGLKAPYRVTPNTRALLDA